MPSGRQKLVGFANKNNISLSILQKHNKSFIELIPSLLSMRCMRQLSTIWNDIYVDDAWIVPNKVILNNKHYWVNEILEKHRGRYVHDTDTKSDSISKITNKDDTSNKNNTLPTMNNNQDQLTNSNKTYPHICIKDLFRSGV